MSDDKAKREGEAVLRRLGARRARYEEEGEALKAAIVKALSDTQGAVSRERAAELLGLHRSTLYELYMPRDERAAA